MLRSSRELWYALAACLAIALLYGFMVLWLRAIPGASDLFGHGLGILGFSLMLMTETLYSCRKRSRRARWGSMARWLEFHIFTGLVGPFLVLLHSSWKFNGLAGIVMLLTVIIVISGFGGRYIYTSVPRTAQGVELEAGEIQAQIQAIEAELAASQAVGVALAGAPGVRAPRPPRPLPPPRQLRQLQKRRSTLQRQVKSLALSRRLLAVWHTIHVPIGLALFTAAFIHIVAAVYYATLLR
jgi:hypothetical protein